MAYERIKEEDLPDGWLDGVCEHILLEDAEVPDYLCKDSEGIYRLCEECA